MNLENAQYSVKEDLLYATALRMWYNCDENKAVFASRRPIYTQAYINTRLAEIDAAQALPNATQRSAMHESIRINMVA